MPRARALAPWAARLAPAACTDQCHDTRQRLSSAGSPGVPSSPPSAFPFCCLFRNLRAPTHKYDRLQPPHRLIACTPCLLAGFFISLNEWSPPFFTSLANPSLFSVLAIIHFQHFSPLFTLRMYVFILLSPKLAACPLILMHGSGLLSTRRAQAALPPGCPRTAASVQPNLTSPRTGLHGLITALLLIILFNV